MFEQPKVSYLYYQTAMTRSFVDSAQGVYIWDRSGKKYLDGSSGAVICNLGHGDKRILDAINKQAESTFFTYRTQFENEPAHKLAELLVTSSANPYLNKVFYVSGGSEAVESAMKLARQYFYARQEGRHMFISRSPGYHGATLGALSVTSYAPLENPYRPMMRPQPRIPAPYCYRCAYNLTYPKCELACAWALEKCILDYGPQNIVAFICEPITGASVGALVPPRDYFDIIRDICTRYEILLILDEVMTGYGRTGKLFAYEHWGLQADIIALSKGMSSGYYPLGATIAREEIVEMVMKTGGFPHGHTHAGSPMSCAVGLKVLEIILEDKLCDNALNMGKILGKGLKEIARKYPFVGDVRGIGLMWALELVADQESRETFEPRLEVGQLLADLAYELGLIIYPRRCVNGRQGDHILVAPPLIISEKEIEELLALLDESLYRAYARITYKTSPT